MNILFIPIILYFIYIYIHTHVNLVYNNKNKNNKEIYHYTYFMWEQTPFYILFGSKLITTKQQIHTSIHFYIFYFGTNISQQSIKFFTKKKKKSIKFIPQYIFICFIWEQTYHQKAINFSPKKESIKFIPQYIFICFIWEQTYHYKALNFSQKKKALNSYLIAFLYILLGRANECP